MHRYPRPLSGYNIIVIQSDENRTAAAPEIEPASPFQDTPLRPPPFRFGLRMAVLSGLLLWLAHPLPGLWLLAWVALAPLLVAVHEASSLRQAALRGYVFGWAYLAPTWYWTGLTIVGWTGSPFGWLALVMLTLLAALFYALWAAAAWGLSRRVTGGWLILGVSGAWVVMEWLRSVGTLSFPWAQVAYSQYKFLPLIQISEVTGALGVSFLVLLMNASIADWWRNRQQSNYPRWAYLCLAIVGLLSLVGIARLSALGDGKPIDVAIMQGNFDYKNGGGEPFQKIRTYRALTQAAYESASPKPQLYVWAETAAPGDAFNDYGARSALQDLSDHYHAALLTGSRIVDGTVETNSALLFTPSGLRPQRFDKVGIVPFGEFIPFRAQIPANLQKQFQFFESDLTPGRNVAPMPFVAPDIGSVSLGPFICYESVYPHYTRTMTALGANLLVTPSHDSWFCSRAAMEQHLGIVVFRAIENRRDVARSTTDGISAAIDGRGRILARAPLNSACFLLQRLHLRSTITLYTRFGDWFVLLCALLFAAAFSHTALRARFMRNSAGKRGPPSAADPAESV